MQVGIIYNYMRKKILTIHLKRMYIYPEHIKNSNIKYSGWKNDPVWVLFLTQP